MESITGSTKWDIFVVYIIVCTVFIIFCCFCVICMFWCCPARDPSGGAALAGGGGREDHFRCAFPLQRTENFPKHKSTTVNAVFQKIKISFCIRISASYLQK